MSKARRTPWLTALGALCLSVACTQVLDIQDARVDPTLQVGAGAVGGEAASIAGSTEQGAGGTGAAVGGHGAGAGSQPSGAAGALGSEAGAGEGGAAGARATPEESNCEAYCDAVLSNCKGKYEQYRTFDQCIEVCKRLPAGTTGDENVNSVECRIRQARFAESEPFVYCKSAGPLGAGKCGSNCVSYCSLMDRTCTASSTAGNLEPSFFDSTQACLAECGALPNDPTGPVQYSSSTIAEPSSFVGNNVFCRTYHVAAALEQDTPSEHCPHARGGDPCIAQ